MILMCPNPTPMILLVADHPDHRQALTNLITDLGYRIDPLDCGDEVLNKLRFRPSRLVILDCDTPDNFDLLSKIRSDPHARTTPVLMFSTDSKNLRDKALLSGADAYIAQRSLDWADLLAEIQRLAGPPNPSNN